MIRNNTFLWVKLTKGNYGRWIISITIDGLSNHFYESDSISEYLNRASARRTWTEHAKRNGLKRHIDWDYEETQSLRHRNSLSNPF